jgi:hypothetical protein
MFENYNIKLIFFNFKIMYKILNKSFKKNLILSPSYGIFLNILKTGLVTKPLIIGSDHYYRSGHGGYTLRMNYIEYYYLKPLKISYIQLNISSGSDKPLLKYIDYFILKEQIVTIEITINKNLKFKGGSLSSTIDNFVDNSCNF